MRLQLIKKKSKLSQMTLISWYWKQKLTRRKHLITYNSHPWIMFSFNLLVVIIWRGGVWLKLDVQIQGGWGILDIDGQVGRGSCKLCNFHWCHMCIIPCSITYVFRHLTDQNLLQYKRIQSFFDHTWEISSNKRDLRNIF